MRLILQSSVPSLTLLHCAWALLVMAAPLSAITAPDSFLANTPNRIELAQAKNCTGAQIEKMLQSGFSKEEIKQLCAGAAPPAAQSGKSDKRAIRGNPLLGTWKAAPAPGEKSLHALLGKEFSKEWEEMQKEFLGGNIRSGTTVRVVE